MIPTRKSLLDRLKDLNDEASWSTFFETYWALIYKAAVHAGLTDAEARDVVQETVIYISRKMPGFTYDPARGSFKSWLRQLVRWQIVDQFRRRQRGVVPMLQDNWVSTGTAPIEKFPDEKAVLQSAAHWDLEWEKTLVEAALRKLKPRISAHHYQMFHFHVVKGWPLQKVAKAMKVSPAKVYLVKHRVAKLFKQEINRLRQKPISS